MELVFVSICPKKAKTVARVEAMPDLDEPEKEKENTM